jgi:hypothetical protein
MGISRQDAWRRAAGDVCDGIPRNEIVGGLTHAGVAHSTAEGVVEEMVRIHRELRAGEAPQAVEDRLVQRGLPHEAAPGVLSELFAQAVRPEAVTLLHQGEGLEEVKRELTERGLDRQAVSAVVDEVFLQRSAQQPVGRALDLTRPERQDWIEQDQPPPGRATSLPSGFRVVGVLCLIFGALNFMCSPLSVFAATRALSQGTTMKHSATALVAAVCGVSLVLAGCWLQMGAPRAWRRARVALWLSAIALSVFAIVEALSFLLDAAIRAPISSPAELVVMLGIFLVFFLILACGVIVLCVTAVRLGAHLRKTQE